MRILLGSLFAIGSLPIALAHAQSLIRLTEDLRSVRYDIERHSSGEDLPEPLFDDNYLSVSGHYHDTGGQLDGYSTQETERSENHLRCVSVSRAECEGQPAFFRIETESRWILRFETLEPCVIRAWGNPPSGAGHLIFRRGFEGAWETEFSTNDPMSACSCFDAALVARPGERFELEVSTFALAKPWDHVDGAVTVNIDFYPFESSTWTHWPTQQSGNGHWYRVVRPGVAIDWDDAALFAAWDSGRLCAISSAAENAFVFGLVDDPRYWNVNALYANGPWLGGVQSADAVEPNGGWAWMTLEPFQFTNWAAGEPNNASGGDERFLNFYCLSPCTRGPTWNDHDSAAGHLHYGDEFRPLAFVVEYDGLPCPDSNDDGRVDLADLAILLSHFGEMTGEPFSEGDMNGDGITDVEDLALLLGHFGMLCP